MITHPERCVLKGHANYVEFMFAICNCKPGCRGPGLLTWCNHLASYSLPSSVPGNASRDSRSSYCRTQTSASYPDHTTPNTEWPLSYDSRPHGSENCHSTDLGTVSIVQFGTEVRPIVGRKLRTHRHTYTLILVSNLGMSLGLQM